MTVLKDITLLDDLPGNNYNVVMLLCPDTQSIDFLVLALSQER